MEEKRKQEIALLIFRATLKEGDGEILTEDEVREGAVEIEAETGVNSAEVIEFMTEEITAAQAAKNAGK